MKNDKEPKHYDMVPVQDGSGYMVSERAWKYFKENFYPKARKPVASIYGIKVYLASSQEDLDRMGETFDEIAKRLAEIRTKAEQKKNDKAD